METINVTFSLPVELNDLMHRLVKKRGLSRFVSQAIQEALESKTHDLYQAYQENAQDELQNSELEDWDRLQSEGWPNG